MRLKALLSFLLFLLALCLLPRPVLASQVPPNVITLSEEIYADLATRNDLDHVSLYYFDGDIGSTVSINAEKSWDPASTIKLFVAMYAFDQAAAGQISLDQPVTIDDKNVAPSQAFENGYPLAKAGDVVSIYELLDRMITQSGNTSYNTLLDVLDRRQVTKYIHDLGLVNSNVGAKLNLDDTQEQIDVSIPGFGANMTNAEDFGRAFILINGKRIPGAAGLFDMLARQKFNDMIPALLPKDVVVAHKTGELDPYYHDGGIVVDSNRRYILSIFSDAGNPGLVAHLSNLVYTRDVNLVGSEFTLQRVSEEPNAPLDPMVAVGEVQRNVLAASTENVKVPTVTAADLGVNPTDLSYILASGELPHVLIPADSAFHFLIDWANKVTSLYPAPPALTVMAETGKLKLKLAEANDLVSRGKEAYANAILQDVNLQMGSVAKEEIVAHDAGLQKAIESVSQTRFSILKSELASANEEGRVGLIKEIASQARDTVTNIKPYVKGATAARNLSQQPLVGQIVASTQTSVTLKTPDGSRVSIPVDPQVKTKAPDQSGITIENVTQIPVGTQVALLGASPDKKIKPFFVLANVPDELANPKPVSVVKVNLNASTIVVASENGVPIQIDLTKNTVIKGENTNVDLNDIKTGDVIVVHGIPITPPPLATGSATPSSTPSSGGLFGSLPVLLQNTATPGPVGSVSATPTGSPSASAQAGVGPSPVSTNLPLQTFAPAGPGQTPTTQNVTAPIQKNVPVSSIAPAGKNPTTGQPANKPQVIKGNVIEVIEKASEVRKQAAPKKESPKPAVPPATPPSKEKEKK